MTNESGWLHQKPLFDLSIANYQTSRSNYQLRVEWWVEKLTSCCYEEPISQILTVGNFTGQKIWSLKQMRWGVAVVEKKIITGCTVWTHLDPSVQSIACPLCPWLQLILQVFVVKVCSCKDVFCPFSWLPLEQRGIYSHPQSLSAWPHSPATSAFMWLHPRLVVVLGWSLLMGSRRQRCHPLFSYIPFPGRSLEREKNQYLSFLSLSSFHHSLDQEVVSFLSIPPRLNLWRQQDDSCSR